MSGQLTRRVLNLLDRATSRLLPRTKERASHLVTGGKGEEEAYFYLRQRGYVMVARNWRSPRRRSEIDLIGWEGGCLCFVEVKTRTSHDVKPAEAAVDEAKRDDLRSVAREYLRRVEGRPGVDFNVRFDIVSVYYEAGSVAPAITLFKNAFGLS
jgi:putative endonuclease